MQIMRNNGRKMKEIIYKNVNEREHDRKKNQKV